MSYFEDASLVLIPSAQKLSKIYSVKPTDGTGDLTFTRSNDTASRVASNGLIERVRTNLVLQSNSFDTAWANLYTTETSGQAGYDGTNNAWLISKSSASANIQQTVVATGLLTQSVYAKAGTLNWFLMNNSGVLSTGVYFDLQNGVLGSVGANAISPSIEAVGGGWYRCSLSFNGTSSAVRIYPADGNNDISGTSGNVLIQAAQLESGDIMTDYIATTSAAVSVGPVANVPRLDYLGSSCPRLLLEPQRTNTATFSESFDNAGWVKLNATVTANAATSPDGYANADKIIENTANDAHSIRNAQTYSSGVTYTNSCFLKADTRSVGWVVFGGNTLGLPSLDYRRGIFDLSSGTIVAAPTGGSAKIEDYGNGWYRCSVTISVVTGGSANLDIYIADPSDPTNNTYTGDGVSGLFAWGAQAEAGAYATSYIPTLGAAVTRGADAANNLAASSLIGTTEGVIFIDIQTPSTIGANSTFSIGAGTSAEYAQIEIRTDLSINWRYRVGGTDYINANVGSFTAGSRLKIAFAYKNLDSILYLNGSSIATDTGTIATNAWDEVRFTNFAGTGNLEARVNQTLLFPTRLSNDSLAALTA